MNKGKNRLYYLLILFLCSCINIRFDRGKLPISWQVINQKNVKFIEDKEKNLIKLIAKNALGGIHYLGNLKGSKYRLSFQIKRLSGIAEIALILLPVGNQSCLLSLGALNDTIFGIGEVNGKNFTENKTTRIKTFDKEWHYIEIYVYEKKLIINVNKRQIKLNLSNNTLKLPLKYRNYRPLSFLTYKNFVLRNIKLKLL